MDYLEESRECLEAGGSTAIQHGTDEVITCYLAGINAALIAIAERLDGPTVQQEPATAPSSTQDILGHLPAELQAAIEAEPPTWEEKQAKKDRALQVQYKRGRSMLFYETGT